MYLQLLKDIVKIQTDWDQTWPKLDSMRKQLATAMSNPAVKDEIGKYVTTANRLSKLDLPEINELKQRIADKAQAVFDSRSAEIYEAQLDLQVADERLAALLTDDELTQMRKDLDNLIAEHADSEPQQTRSLVFRRGARLAINALGADN
jgi:septum formation topological specificity factor MinE